ncbi:sugar transferase [Cerasicoccus arenae]|uniref:Sugar transferase n=1 Tax=Cerasicoccus arenae TaxID=424488 RepID=A0A8J3DIW5_9BACT|nr:sugar transferase [Cerasicoccus arenae]MBK1858660.1 sugar transferase [Cerasicoccus arenae]GHC04744.1 sugar transferase [Cerasicoccus arenae]
MKRVFDFLFAATLLFALSPLLVLLCILVRIKLGSPIFFIQPRPGLNGHVFNLIKFRTMTDACDQMGNPLSDSQRLTSFGRWLRGVSLDELPELWNILRGEMSFVGPRPLLVRYLVRYTPEQARRHAVRPGITGWAQVNGRNAITWEERFRLDVWYVDHRSFILDLKIIAMTLGKVLRREGVSPAGADTMPEFMGDQQ